MKITRKPDQLLLHDDDGNVHDVATLLMKLVEKEKPKKAVVNVSANVQEGDDASANV